MTETEKKELDEILMNDPLLACDVIDEKSNYQYTVRLSSGHGEADTAYVSMTKSAMHS